MFTLFFIWLAGGFASLGAVAGVAKVEDAYISPEVKFEKFVQSWYAFGLLVGIMIAEIGQNTKGKQ
jgi:hypothetical protein